ncbi:MAG: sulfide/dihydroorotate dehydrogenase-like FAD/NAD-binding protein [Spirochaetota bacterium]|nr:sulfide/dihydroorotate dehydrogenase-like FAD/NAD-binding protein [Spirochaetota bacterium]
MGNKIVKKEGLAEEVIRMVIEAPEIASKRKPGQFIILRVNESGERIPLTIADSDSESGTITIIFQVVGKSTMLLRDVSEGEEIADIVGPLGTPTHIENFGTVCAIGGGAGTAVIYPIAKALREAGNRLISIVGSRNKGLLILREEMSVISDRLLIATDDGTEGIHGFVTDVLQQIIDEGEKVDVVFAIGPLPMMRAVSEMTRPLGIKTIVSLNPIMIDGTGMCGCCRVIVNDETRFACVDGPEFDGHEVDYQSLGKRLKAYQEQEKEACRCYESR